MQEPTDPNWWRLVECHMNPSWNLATYTMADEKKLKKHIEIRLQREYAPDFMPVESLLFRAWLDVSLVRLQNSTPSLSVALKYVKEAEKCLSMKETDKFAYVGYGTVVYSFLLWLHEKEGDEQEFKNAKVKLLGLLTSEGSGITGDLHPKARAYVHATRAFALSRLGESHMRQSVNLFKIALRRNPSNVHWQFCQAKILFRIFNMQKLATYGYKEKPLSPLLKRKFTIVKTILENINEAHPNFHWANAYLGTVLFFIKENCTSHWESLVTEALNHEQKNFDIVLLAVKVYKQMKDFEKCFFLLNGLPEDFKTTEVYFQLGILYFEQLKNYEDEDINHPDQRDLFDKCLENLEKAIKLDCCKVSALLKRAELYAKWKRLDETFSEKARDFYKDVTCMAKEKGDYSNEFHVTRSKTYKEVAEIFTPSNRVKNYYDHFAAIVKADDFAYRNEEGRLILSSEYDGYAKRATGILRRISVGKGLFPDERNSSVRVSAKLYLARCKHTLGELEECVQIYESLSVNEGLEEGKISDINLGLAECFYGLEDYEKAKAKLQESPKNRIEKKTLLANIYIAEAKQLQKQMRDKFTQAIESGNMESCLEMLLTNGNFCKDFFSVEGRVAQILSKIKTNVRTRVNGENGQIALHQLEIFKTNINEKCDKILTPHLTFAHCTPVFVDTFEDLAKLRSLLLAFECSLLFDETTSECSTEEGSARCSEGRCGRQTGRSASWQSDSQQTAKHVLKKALSLFNQSIKCLQDTLLSSEVQHKLVPNSTTFPLLNWKSEDDADEFLASDDLQKLLIELFPDDFEAYIPPDMFDYLLQIQPTVDEKNIWLEVLSKFVEDLKGDTLPQDTYKCILGNESVSKNFCTVHIARKSCEEAEKMVMTVLQKCQELCNQENDKAVHLRNWEE